MLNRRTKEENEVLKRLGERLRGLRISRGITQEALADEAGFSRSYYNEIETGKRNVSFLNLYRLAKALNASPKELLDIDTRTI